MCTEHKPDWLRVRYNRSAVDEMAALMQKLNLNTVCREANCPNLGECYGKHTATFMILGDRCTRNCRFCNVQHDRPEPMDPEEPVRVAQAVKQLGLHHVVVTSVTRDDLPDGGAAHFAAVIREVRQVSPDTAIEVLIPDLGGAHSALDTVLNAEPDVFAHNMETIRALYPSVRPQAIYERSLSVLAYGKAHRWGGYIKTGFMVGLGEREDQIDRLMYDILETGCDMLTIGQYLSPSPAHAARVRYVTQEEFERYKEMALRLGFAGVVSAPLARSSYGAGEALSKLSAGREAALEGRASER